MHKAQKATKILNIGLLTLLLGFTTYIGLDTFVITRVYATVQTKPSTGNATQISSEMQEIASIDSNSVLESDITQPDVTQADTTMQDSVNTQTENPQMSLSTQADTNTESTNTTHSSAAPISTETSYKDENIEINISTYYEHDSYIYVADVKLDSATYLQTALAQNLYGKNVTATTSATAEANHAILAVNGDYYGIQESGYVIRNGVLYRDTARSGQEDLVIYSDGHFEIINESEITAQELLEKGAIQVLSFGPGLVMGGQIEVTQNEEVGKAMASNPRTAIGIYDDLHYAFVVSDGRTNESEGLSLYELADFMQNLGVQTAYNLDGGGSSTMYFNGNIINNPTTRGNSIKERKVSDIVYIGYE